MATAKGYTNDDRKRIVSDMQSMCDRLGESLVRTYGDQFDGDIDIDTMLEAINFMKALRFEKPAALAEPLFLLHTGAVCGGERDDWEIEANSDAAVDDYCDANPGKTVGLYLATPAQQPDAADVTDEYARAFHDGWLACERGDAEPPVPAQHPAAAVPEGYALVPVEPTEAMLDAGHAAAWRRIPSCFDMTDAEIVYRAMLAAAERKGAGNDHA